MGMNERRAITRNRVLKGRSDRVWSRQRWLHDSQPFFDRRRPWGIKPCRYSARNYPSYPQLRRPSLRSYCLAARKTNWRCIWFCLGPETRPASRRQLLCPKRQSDLITRRPCHGCADRNAAQAWTVFNPGRNSIIGVVASSRETNKKGMYLCRYAKGAKPAIQVVSAPVTLPSGTCLHGAESVKGVNDLHSVPFSKICGVVRHVSVSIWSSDSSISR